MFIKVFLCCILFLFQASVNGDDGQNFTIKASSTWNYIIPMFSLNLTDFQATIDFFLALPNLPSSFSIYASKNGGHQLFPCFTKSYQCLYYTNSSINSTDFQELIYSQSIVSPDKVLEFSQNALNLILTEAPLCVWGLQTCTINRINFIILTDYSNLGKIYQNNQQLFTQIFNYVISSGEYEVFVPIIGQKYQIKYYFCDRDEPDKKISDEIFDNTVLYTINTYDNFYNIFMVINETSLNTTINIAENLLLLPDPLHGWGNLNPRLYTLAIKRNETFYYQTTNVFLGGMSRDNFWESVTTRFNSTSTVLQTTLLEQNLKNIFQLDHEAFFDIQWNILISDQFPYWIKNTGIIFDSFQKHFDVYIFPNPQSGNVERERKLLEDEIIHHLNDIIVDDGNATIRGNHLMLISLAVNTTKQLPTFKNIMDSRIFTYTAPKQKRWFWYAVGVFTIIFLISIILFLLWRRKMHRKLEEKYSWAIKSGISIQEADNLIEKGKELFIDGKWITVDFNKIIGKGSSAIVYEGLLSTVSPIATLYPRLETQNFTNCKAAIKIGNTFSKDEFEQIFREVEAAAKIGWHRHICCLLGWSVHQTMPILVFELIEGKDLLSWAQSFQDSVEEKEMPEKIVTQILWQISDGMEHISSLGILHKDLAARNILLSQRMEAKITDFGLASCCDESFTYEAPAQRRLPLRWMAPEALKNRIFSEGSDVWAFGILAWEVFSKGAIPYGTIDGNDILEFLQAGDRLKLPEEVSDAWKKMLEDCWSEQKEERPSFKEIRIQIGAFLETQTINYGYLSCDVNDS